MGDEYYNGIKIRGPINITDEFDEGYLSAAAILEGENVTWFKVNDRYLGAPSVVTTSTMTPSELIQMWFGDDLTASDDGASSNYRRRTMIDRPLDFTMYDEAMWRIWRNTTTTAYMVTAVIGNLPPISTGTDGISGFLDWSQPWGLVYDADVLYKNMTGHESFSVAMATGDDASAARINENLVNSMMTRDWIVAGPDDGTADGEDSTQNSVWPQGAYAGLLAWYDDPDTFVGALTAFGSGRPMAYATYALEAIGYDAYDDIGADDVTIDANEALHSNELYRFAPPDASEEVMHAPGILTAAPLGGSPGTFYISWTYPSELHQTFAGAYHAESDEGDSYTHVDSDNPWIKTHDQEIQDMNSTIDEVCKIIGPTLETTEFPKRFINHIQRKRKIPNNLVSAFGYVPGEMYTAGAVDTYVLGEDDKISYNPVTGEKMDDDAMWKGLTDEEMVALGLEGGYGTRGGDEADSRWSEGGTGEGWTSDDDTGDSGSPDWWDDEDE